MSPEISGRSFGPYLSQFVHTAQFVTVLSQPNCSEADTHNDAGIGAMRTGERLATNLTGTFICMSAFRSTGI